MTPAASISPPMIAARRRYVWALLVTGLTTVFAGCGIEERLIFHPSATIARTPRQAGLEFEEVFFTARDGVRLHGWFVPHRRARSTLIWFHGNAGNISHRVDNIKLLHDRVNVHVFIFDYRGYGRSEGRVSEAGTYLDGEAALDHVRQRLGADAGNIILFGRSLGAAVATEIAIRFDSQGLILESPFISIAEMARVVMPFLPIGGWLRTGYDVRAKIKAIRVPLLVLHGDRDEIVPFSQGKVVFDAAPQPKKFFSVAGASHNDTYVVGGESYFQQLSDFVDWAKARRQRTTGPGAETS